MRLCEALSARRQYLDGVHAGTRRPSTVDVAVRLATVTDTEPYAGSVPEWKFVAGVRCVPKELQPHQIFISSTVFQDDNRSSTLCIDPFLLSSGSELDHTSLRSVRDQQWSGSQDGVFFCAPFQTT